MAEKKHSKSDGQNSQTRPTERYPFIPLPQRRRGRRPEIPRGPSKRLGWLRGVIVGLIWCLAMVMAAGAALRVFWHDGWIPLVWWNSFTLYVYLPIYVCVMLALILRRWRLAGLSAAVAVCHLIWIAPDYIPRDGLPFGASDGQAGAEEASGPSFRLYYQNLNQHMEDFEPRIEAILAEDPDVIALVEFVPSWETAVRDSTILTDYPHHTLRPNPARSQQLAIFSKRPLEEIEYRYVLGRRLAVAATVRVEEEPVRLYCLHAPRPIPEQAEQFRDYCRDAIDWISQSDGARVVVGDFNSTQHAAWYQRLCSRGRLHSAHREVGRGFAVTWPNGRTILPSIRIDHALLSPEVTCRSIREGDGGHSDHKPLICDLVVASGDGEEENGGNDE